MDTKVLLAFLGLLILSAAMINTTTDVTKPLSTLVGKDLSYSIWTGYLPVDWYFKDSNTSIFYEVVSKVNTKFP